MKKSFLLSLIFVILHISNIFSQTKLTGEIVAAKSKLIVISYWKDFSYKEDTVKLDKDNRFTKSYEFSIPMYFRLNIATLKNSFILLYPGEDLHVKLKDDTILFTGSASDYNRFWVDLEKETSSMHYKLGYDSTLNYALQQSNTFFKTFKDKYAKEKESLSMQSLIIGYKLYPFLLNYERDSLKIDTLLTIIKTKRLPGATSSLYAHFDKIDYHNEIYRYDQSYLNGINNLIKIIRFRTAKKSEFVQVDAFEIEKDIIKNVFSESPLRTALMAFALNFRIKNYRLFPYQLTGIDKFISDFSHEVGSSEYISTIKKTYWKSLPHKTAE